MMRMLWVMVALVIALSGSSGNVDSNKAGKVAINWYRHYAPPAKNQAVITKTIPYQYNGRECFYIFSFDKGGFVLVSANDAVTPVLGYGFDHPVPDSITNEAVKGWFDGYARQIDTAFVLHLKSDASASKWDEILANTFPKSPGNTVGPLLTTTWNQVWPYNAMCPEDPIGSGGHASAGCVAVAMAQVMKYWNYPSTGYDTISYEGGKYGVIGANFGKTTYQWQNMPNSISDTNIEIAKLIYHAGLSVQSIYNAGSTGAWSGSARDGLVRFFKYAYSDIKWFFNLMEFYTPVQWDSIIHQELDSLRPVIYRAESLTGPGHSFVCDGYDSTGFYHFNFGWGGGADGFYQLSCPFIFNWAPGMVIGIKPNDGSTVLQDQIWSGNIQIHKNTIFLDYTKLSILPNTRITFDPKCSLRIAGTFQAAGTINDSIVLTASDTAYRWSGLSIEKGNWHEADSSFLTYTKIEYSDNGGLRINGIKNIMLSHCLIWKNKRYPYTAGNGAYWNAFEALGGGLSIHSTNAEVRDCRFLHNWTYYGGGAIAVDGSCDSVNFIKNTIEYNYSQGKGGGVYLGGACEKVNVMQNTLSENFATIEGGAIMIENVQLDSIPAYPIIASNYISGNSAAYSAGIYSVNSDVMIINNVIAENTCYGMGNACLTLIGGESLTDVHVINNTIVNNLGSFGTIGVYGSNLFQPRFINSVFSGNPIPQINIGNQNINPVFQHCYIEHDSLDFIVKRTPTYFTDTLLYKQNLSIINPRFNPDSLWAPLHSSPLIDIGSSPELLPWVTNSDILDNPRVKRKIDIGAYENQSDTLFPCILRYYPDIHACLNDSIAIQIEARGDNLSFFWFHDGTLLPDDTSCLLVRNSVLNSDSGQYMCIIENPFGTDTTSFSLIVHESLPDTNISISGNDSLVHYQCYEFSTGTDPDICDYIWIVSDGLEISSLTNGKKNITIQVKPTAAMEYIGVKGVNPCGTSSDWSYKPLFCDSIPPIIGGYDYINPNLCTNTTSMYQYSFGSCLNSILTFEWELPLGCHIQWQNQGVIGFNVSDSAVGGMIRIRWTKPGYGVGSWREDSISIHPPLSSPPGPILGSDTIYTGQTAITYSVPNLPHATGYEWHFPEGVTIINGNNTPIVNINCSNQAVSGLVYLRCNNGCGYGLFSDSLFMNILTLPVQTQVFNDTLVDGESACFNATQTITVAGNGTTFMVQDGGSVSLIAGQNIRFLPGVKVNPGGYLHGYITTTNDYCFSAMKPEALVQTKQVPEEIIETYDWTVKIFPNPTSGILNLVVKTPDPDIPVQIRMYNLLGEMVYSKELIGKNTDEISLADEHPGIYLLHVVQGERSEVVKVIRNR